MSRSLWYHLYSFASLISTLFLHLPYISLDYHHDYIARSHCTFFYQENTPERENKKKKSFEKSNKRRRISNTLLAESLLCGPRMPPAENKRLEVHACSPRPHINPPPSLFHPSTPVFFPSALKPYSSLSLSLSHNSLSLFFHVYHHPPFISFLVLHRNKAFRCCAALRQSTSSIYAVALSSPLTAVVPLRVSRAYYRTRIEFNVTSIYIYI